LRRELKSTVGGENRGKQKTGKGFLERRKELGQDVLPHQGGTMETAPAKQLII